MHILKRMNIVNTYLEIDDDDISTERLIALVCDKCHCQIEDVIYALEEAGMIHEHEEN